MDARLFDTSLRWLTTELNQQPAFPAYSSPDIDQFDHQTKCLTIFQNALILHAITSLSISSSNELIGIKKTLAEWLMQQKSPNYSWNYWAKESAEYKTKPYPDDLDDTFWSLIALYRYQPNILNPQAFGAITRLLTYQEQEEGGPYYTWIVSEKVEAEWKDVDLAVNAAVGYFLSLQEISLSRLNQFLDQAIHSRQLNSPYYPSHYPIIYTLSHFYQGQYQDQLAELLLSQRLSDGSWGNPLFTALAVASLINLNTTIDLRSSVAYLMESRQDGHWPAIGYCYDPAVNHQPRYSGSEALTTAFCLEALSRYQKTSKRTSTRPLAQDEPIDAIAKTPLYRVVRQQLNSLLPPQLGLQPKLEIMINRLLSREEGHEIVLLPQLIADSINRPITNDLIAQLSTANLLGWIAHTIYDDMRDHNKDSELLPLADFALPHSFELFMAAASSKKTKNRIKKIFKITELANRKESRQHRLKKVGRYYQVTQSQVESKHRLLELADKSFGHAISAIIIIIDQIAPDVAETIENFFRYYLTARQLNDDLHDWQDDLRTGWLNPVSRAIIKEYLSKRSGLELKLSESTITKLEVIFWQKIAPQYCKKVLDLSKKARTALMACSSIKEAGPILTLLEPVDRSAQIALDERQATIQFLKTFHG